MVTASNGQEPYEWHLHARQRSQCVPRCVAHVYPWAESSHANEDEDVQWQQVRNEHIPTPSADHVSIEQRTQSCPHDAALLYSFNPEVESED